MKEIKKLNCFLFVLFSFVMLGTNSSIAQNNKLIASCCEGEGGRCTGSSYCTACTNCSRCKHCNSGGSCGVCAGGSRRTTTTKSYKSNSTNGSSSSYSGNSSSNSFSKNNNNRFYSSETYDLPNDVYSEYYLKTLIVNAETLNLRSGPGANYEILEKLTKNQELVFLAMTGDWVKVRVKSTNTIGFVNYKYVLLSE